MISFDSAGVCVCCSGTGRPWARPSERCGCNGWRPMRCCPHEDAKPILILMSDSVRTIGEWSEECGTWDTLYCGCVDECIPELRKEDGTVYPDYWHPMPGFPEVKQWET